MVIPQRVTANSDRKNRRRRSGDDTEQRFRKT